MENRKRNCRRKDRRVFTRLFLDSSSGNPEAIENQDWYLDSPGLGLTRIFSAVLLLHIMAGGGILASRLWRTEAASSETLAFARLREKDTTVVENQYAGSAPSREAGTNLEEQPQYKVVSGDTLAGIAAKTGVSPEALRRVNGLANPKDIRPGMWLLLPMAQPATANLPRPAPNQVKSGEAGSTSIPPSQGPKSASSKEFYTVQKGDTIWGISQKCQVDAKKLMELNGISRPEALQNGRRLEIPGR